MITPDITHTISQRFWSGRVTRWRVRCPTFGELAWNWGKGHARDGASWPRRLWFFGGTHPGYRRRGLARAMLLHGMHRARAAGATHMTVACRGAPGHPEARGLCPSVGFRELSRDAPLMHGKATTGG
jgi:GNAT superfamily N-acetyltransferase